MIVPAMEFAEGGPNLGDFRKCSHNCQVTGEWTLRSQLNPNPWNKQTDCFFLSYLNFDTVNINILKYTNQISN